MEEEISRRRELQQRIQKFWYIYIMEYYSAIENNDFMKFLGK